MAEKDKNLQKISKILNLYKEINILDEEMKKNLRQIRDKSKK